MDANNQALQKREEEYEAQTNAFEFFLAQEHLKVFLKEYKQYMEESKDLDGFDLSELFKEYLEDL